MPYVDNSYKWGGGGILSTVGDLMKYGNHLLTAYQNDETVFKHPYVKQSTIKNHLWSKQSVPSTKYVNRPESISITSPNEIQYYGMGWQLVFDKENNLKYLYHTGGAVGCVSCLLIVPSKDINKDHHNNNDRAKPNGLVVTVLCNSDSVVGIANFTSKISKIFLENK